MFKRSQLDISKLPDHDRDQAEAILRWVTFALRPPTVLEITKPLLLRMTMTMMMIIIDKAVIVCKSICYLMKLIETMLTTKSWDFVVHF